MAHRRQQSELPPHLDRQRGRHRERTGMSSIMFVYSSFHFSAPSANEKSMSFQEIRHVSAVTAETLRPQSLRSSLLSGF